MRKTTLLILVFWSLNLSAQIAFQKTLIIGLEPTNNSSTFKTIMELSDGSFLVGGEYGNGRLFTTKLSANGDSLWTKSYQYPGFVSASMVRVFKDIEGFTTVCGSVSRQAAGSWFYLFRLDENGDTISTKRFPINGSVNDIVQLEDSGYVFTTNNQQTNGRIYRVTKDMSQVWSYVPFPSRLDSVPLNTLFNGIKYRDGALFISARWSFGGMTEAYLGKWGLDGKAMFFKKYAYGQGLNIVDMEMTKQNNCLLVGSSSLKTNPGLFTEGFSVMRTSSNGDSIDIQHWDGPITDNAYSISEGKNLFLVTGMGSTPDYGQTVSVLGLDESGTIKWNTNLKIVNENNPNSAPTHSGYYAIETSDEFIVAVGFRNSNAMGGPRESFIAKFKPQLNTSISNKIQTRESSLIFPNPTTPNSLLNIINPLFEKENSEIQIQLINVSGSVVHQIGVPSKQKIEMSIPQLAPGVYGMLLNNRYFQKIQIVE